MEWMLEQAQKYKSDDIYNARSWLLVAKSMFPHEFLVYYEGYKLEYGDKNVEKCSAFLGEMFQKFPSEIKLWRELESLIIALESKEKSDEFKQEIFDALPSAVQQRMIISSAKQQNDVAQQCKLMLVLMEKYPSTISDYGVPLAEKLVDDEKEEGCGSSLNNYRRVLVCDVLPVICKSSELTVSHKHYYKWLQKATEFYATYFTTDPKIILNQIGRISQSWTDVDRLRKLISIQCEWEERPEQSKSLQERMNHIKDLHKRSRSDLTGNINKKQIFYTAILLLFEAAIKYIELLEPKMYQDKADCDKSRMIVLDWNEMESNEASSSSTLETRDGVSLTQREQEIKETFLVARDARYVLLSNESFEKDFQHLYRRWKMDRWTWLQLFLTDFYTNDRNYKLAQGRLNNLMERDIKNFREQVVLRCHCQLVASYYANAQLLMASQSIMEALDHLSEPDNLSASQYEDPVSPPVLFSDLPSGDKLRLLQLDFSHLLPFWIHILMKCFLKILASEDDDIILGHVIVLSQHEWPKWQTECKQSLETVSKKSRFKYPVFFDYVINIDILEEIAYLKNNGTCELVLLQEQPTSAQRVTRGVNKGAKEDFKKALKRQVRRSDDNVNLLIREFLTKEQNLVLNCLQTESSIEILEPMEVDH